jgi:septal ring factor EnvC (AmiA/AmiB activator)
MRKWLVLVILLGSLVYNADAQSRKELEDERRKTLEEIAYMDNLLKTTSREKSESLNELKIIGRKLNLRESVLKGLQDEIGLLTERIELNNLAVEMMESDLILLKKDYEKAVMSTYRSSKGNREIGFVLSASDFNQGYKRLKYLQQVTKYRRAQSEIIMELKSEIEISRKKMEEDLVRMSELKTREEQQKYLLQSEQSNQQKVVKSLSNKEKQLQRELEEKRRVARRIESELSKIMAEEKRKAGTTDMTPEMRLISDNFQENKGRLPWPVERGIITSHFGVHNHPVLKYVRENNTDIEITSSGPEPVRAVFKGTVARVFSITGANMSIIVKHGRFYTVYSNLVNVQVKQGDNVDTKQVLGTVFSDSSKGNTSVLKFMITEETVNLDPELWISKKN